MQDFALSPAARPLFVLLVVVTLFGAHLLYRPGSRADGWVRCQYAPVVRQLILVLGAGLFALVVLGTLRHGARGTGAWIAFAFAAGGILSAVECCTRRVDFSPSGLQARSAWGSPIRASWSQVVRIDRKWYLDMYRFHFDDGRRLILPDLLVGLEALLCEAVRQLPVRTYSSVGTRLGKEIPRLECELQGAIQRVERSGIDGVRPPDTELAALGLSLPLVFQGGLDAYYRDERGALADWLALALRRIGARQHAELLERANRWVSGSEGLLRDLDARVAALDHSAGVCFQALRQLDAEFAAEPTDLEPLLREYVDSFGDAAPDSAQRSVRTS